MTVRRVEVADRIATTVVWGSAVGVCLIFLLLLGDVVRHGIGALSLEFVLAEPRGAGREGGIGPVLVSTGLILGVCLAVAVPLGLGTAILLAEVTRKGDLLGILVRRSLDVLAGVPSIVFGLFGNAFFAVNPGTGLLHPVRRAHPGVHDPPSSDPDH